MITFKGGCVMKEIVIAHEPSNTPICGPRVI